MIDLLFCGYNLSCHFNSLRPYRPKYPPDVAQICYYFEEQKAELPDYCKWKTEPFIPKRRGEF